MKVLATGAAGFIGSEHVRSLLAGDLPGPGGVPVTVLDKLSYSANLAAAAGHPGPDTQVLLESAWRHRVDRFVHISTEEVYGSISPGSWTDQSALALNTPYLVSKARSDLVVLAYRAGWERVDYVTDRKGQDIRSSLDTGKAREELAQLAGWRNMLADAPDRPAFAAGRGGPR